MCRRDGAKGEDDARRVGRRPPDSLRETGEGGQFVDSTPPFSAKSMRVGGYRIGRMDGKGFRR